MAEGLSPNPATVQKQRALMSARIQSPTSPFFLGSNDDQLERAQARASRAAAIRRKSIAFHAPPPPTPDPCLGKEQILELFQNCIKLASENVRTLSYSRSLSVVYMVTLFNPNLFLRVLKSLISFCLSVKK